MALVLLLTFLLASCHRARKLSVTEAVTDRASMPVLTSKQVTTLISDSGITRYRITTPAWQIYDKAEPSYWEFPEGVYLEKFDSTLHVEASLQSDYARYHEDRDLWELRGHVHALNLKGEEFDTPLLYWDKKSETVYSDSTISIKKAKSIIYGVGFESNQQMTNYTIQHPTGMIPLDEDKDSDQHQNYN